MGQKFTFIHSNASLHCFPFLITGISVKIGSILDSILIFFGKKEKIHVLGIETDLDPAKRCGSDPIRIHNTGQMINKTECRL